MDIALIIWTAATTAFLFYVMKYIWWRSSRRFPPGPWGLPIFGYTPFLSKTPFRDYIRLREKYGDVVGLRLGCRYTAVLSNYEDIKETYNKEAFLNRPPNWFQLSDKSDHLANMGGREWKETHKLTVTAFRNLGVGKEKVEESIKEEVRKVVETLEGTLPETEVNIFNTIYLPLLNVILTIICGRIFDDGDGVAKMMEKFNIDIIRYVVEHQNKILYPFLKPYYRVRNWLIPSVAPVMEDMDKFMAKEVGRHSKEFNENNLEDFISFYISEMKKASSKKTCLTYPNLQLNSTSLLFAGTDASRGTLAWIFMYLAKYHEYQEKMYQEIVDHLGKEKPPSWSDKEHFPYTNAFVMEVQRHKTVSATWDPRWADEEDTIGGFCIPKNTMVIANVAAVHNDKKLWGDPENFRPERFLSQDGKSNLTPEYWIPFLVGKRTCPGSKLANLSVFLFVTSVVQKLKIVPPASGLSFEDIDVLMIFPVKPIVSFQVRK